MEFYTDLHGQTRTYTDDRVYGGGEAQLRPGISRAIIGGMCMNTIWKIA
jgi:hypothetical protein